PRRLAGERREVAAGVPGRHVGPGRGGAPDPGRRPRVENAVSEPAPSVDAAGFTAYPAKPVDIEQIERELTAMWSEPPAGADAAPVTRACMSNLIVFAPDRDAASRLGDEIVPLVEHHPSRVLMLVVDPAKDGDQVEAYVSALCHLGDGGRQVCS